MKIAYLSSSTIPSLTANSIHVMKMCQAFAAIGHKVLLFANISKVGFKRENIFNYYGVKQKFAIKLFHNFELKYFEHFNGFLMAIEARLFKPDIVIGRHLAGCFFTSLAGIKTFFEIHSPIEESGKLTKFLFEQMINFASFQKLVVITCALKKYYELRYPELKNRVLVLPDAADSLDVENIQSAGIRLKNTLNVGYTGHLYKGKGMELLFGLIPICPFAHFHIVGGRLCDINYWGEKMFLYPNVTFHGYRPHSEIPSFLNDFDIVLLPNQNEVHGNASRNIGGWTSPLKLFEYMAARKAIIASDLPVLREVLENKKTALLCSPKNIDAWKKSLELLRDNIIFRKQLGSEANKVFLKKYTWISRAKKIFSSCN
jgi:glycosyltransferase involved in cell wall biosynthesis